MMKLILIAAVGSERQLGLNNELLWDLPGDLPRFKEITMGSPIIMGRKTFDSIGRPLPGRKNIVISRDTKLELKGATVCHTVEEAMQAAAVDNEQDQAFIIGGGEIYSLFLPNTDTLELTEVVDSPEADAFFPEYQSNFAEVARIRNEANGLRYDYVRYERSARNDSPTND